MKELYAKKNIVISEKKKPKKKLKDVFFLRGKSGKRLTSKRRGKSGY